MGQPMPYAPDVDYAADWAYGASSNNNRLRRQQHRACARRRGGLAKHGAA